MTKLEEYTEQVNQRLDPPATDPDELEVIREKFLDNISVGFTAGTIYTRRQEQAGQIRMFEGELQAAINRQTREADGDPVTGTQLNMFEVGGE